MKRNDSSGPNYRGPFDEVFVPVADAAERELRAISPGLDGLVSRKAISDSKQGLLRFLAAISSQPLELNFSVYRWRHAPVTNEHGTRNIQYRAFIRHLIGNGFDALLREYPVLADLIALATRQWIETNAEFVSRFSKDRLRIADSFNAGRNPGRIVGFRSNMSDRHNGGRTVIISKFESGLRLVYKPRDLWPEHFYVRLVNWLNRNGSSLQLRVCKMVRSSSHGWMEYVDQVACRTEDEARRYYIRAGMLQCIFQAIGATDCHMSNVVANGEQPVLVDVETVFQPGHWRVPGPMASPWFTGFVPNPAVVPDVSGLGGADGQSTDFRIPAWKNIYKDELQLDFLPAVTQRQANAVLLKGVSLSAARYAREFSAGFEDMYRLLITHRDALLARPGPLAGVAGRRVRLVIRPTREYISILGMSLSPLYLRDPKMRSRFFRGLGVGERKALKRLDVPRFEVIVNRRAPFEGLKRLTERDLRKNLRSLEIIWALIRR